MDDIPTAEPQMTAPEAPMQGVQPTGDSYDPNKMTVKQFVDYFDEWVVEVLEDDEVQEGQREAMAVTLFRSIYQVAVKKGYRLDQSIGAVTRPPVLTFSMIKAIQEESRPKSDQQGLQPGPSRQKEAEATTKQRMNKEEAEKGRSQSRGRSASRGRKRTKDMKDTKVQELTKQVTAIMAEVEKLSEGLSFLTKPEIVNIAAKKYMAPPELKKMAQPPKRDPQNPWGKGMSLVKGPGTKTMILHPSKGVEVNLELVQESLVYLTPEQVMLKEEAVDVKTVTKARSGAVVVTAKDNLSLKQKAALHSIIGAALDNAEMREVEKKTHSCLKFDFLPTRHQDGAEIMIEEMTRELKVHPQWRDAQLVEIPKMIKSRTPNMCTLLCKVEDDAKGTRVKQLLKTAVSFGVEMR